MKIDITKYDDCCYMVSIKKDGEQVESGIWCPVSKRLAIDGELIGLFNSEEEIKKFLKPIPVTTTKYRHNKPLAIAPTNQ